MRPSILTPLFAALRSLPGIGPRLELLLQKAIGADASRPARVLDLLWHVPTGTVDRSARPKIGEARVGELATLEVTVTEHRPGRGRRRGQGSPYRILVEDETGALELVYFNINQRYVENLLPVGSRRIVSGRLESYDGWLQMPHPDHVTPAEDAQGVPLIEPVYPLTAGLTNKTMRKAVQGALTRLPDMPEWSDPHWLKQNRWPSFTEALRAVHAPESAADLAPESVARTRLAYDELLASQLALALVRQRLRRSTGRPLVGTGTIRKAILAALPFTLTDAQVRALSEIDADLGAEPRMLRLLQGDVGSGKTVVALLAMASAVEAGAQAALMVPTEILARQHLKTITEMTAETPLRVALLTGRERGKEREKILQALGTGEIDILIGTHALFQESVAFRDLGLVVVDEQHRFGVHQRLALQAKGTGSGAEILVMTATPIPRSLQLAAYGDMDVSKLDQKPKGRKPIATRAVPNERLEEVIAHLERAISQGTQAYWVCPLVAESETLDIAAAEERYADLKARFGDKVALVHGQLKASEKDRVMADFASGAVPLLVATTVIEVGVDVPKASIMIIEHAERFGLAQLHQLRGRVGRGAEQSSCILVYKPPLSETARARLEVMRQSDDGFVIAEEDLRLRGGGEILGTRQSGLPALRFARLPEDEALLAAARDEARLLIARDPELKGPRGEALRLLLYLFERDAAIRLLRAG
jgi:ATP-dependent DNA helicase RecG